MIQLTISGLFETGFFNCFSQFYSIFVQKGNENQCRFDSFVHEGWMGSERQWMSLQLSLILMIVDLKVTFQPPFKF